MKQNIFNTVLMYYYECIEKTYVKKDILAAIVVGVVLQPLRVKLLNTNTIDFPHVNSW